LQAKSWTNSSKGSQARCGDRPALPDWPRCLFPAKHAVADPARHRLPHGNLFGLSNV
jgi:hypothetical protein